MNPNASVNKLFTTRCFITVKTFLYKHAGHYQVNGGKYCGEQLRCFLNISNWVKGLRESKVACHRYSLEDSLHPCLPHEGGQQASPFSPTHFGSSNTNAKVLNQFRHSRGRVVQLSKELGSNISQASFFILYGHIKGGRLFYQLPLLGNTDDVQ